MEIWQGGKLQYMEEQFVADRGGHCTTAVVVQLDKRSTLQSAQIAQWAKADGEINKNIFGVEKGVL